MTGPSSPRVGLISDRAPTCAPKAPFQQFYLRSAKKTGSENGPKSPKIFVTVKSKLVAKIDTDRMKPLTISSCGVACIHTDNRTNVSQKTHDQSRRVIFHRTVRETPERQTKEREREREKETARADLIVVAEEKRNVSIWPVSTVTLVGFLFPSDTFIRHFRLSVPVLGYSSDVANIYEQLTNQYTIRHSCTLRSQGSKKVYRASK